MISSPYRSLGAFLRRPLTASFAWSFGGDLASKLGVLVFTLIVARALHPIQFGVFVGLFATVSIAAGLWDLGVSSLLTRELAAGHVSLTHATHRSLAIRAQTLPVLIVAYGAGVAILRHTNQLSDLAIAAFALSALLVGLHAIPLSMLRARLLFRDAAAVYAAGRWLTVGLALVVFAERRGSARLDTYALTLMAGELLTLVLGIAAAKARLLGTREEVESPSSLTVRAALPFATTSLLALVYNRLDVVLLASLSTAEQLARYAPASRIQDALFLLPTSVGAVSLPVIASAWSKPDGQAYVQRFVRRVTAASLAVAIPVTALTFVFAPTIIRVGLGASYLGTVTPMRILICFLPFAAASAPLIAALAGTGHALDATKVFLLAFGIAIGLHFSFDWWWGANGAATASLTRDPAALALALLLGLRIGIRSYPLRAARPGPSGAAP